MVTASVVSFEHIENNQGLGLYCFLSLNVSDVLPLVDLPDRPTMLEAPMRLPRLMVLSWKKEPVDWSRNITECLKTNKMAKTSLLVLYAPLQNPKAKGEKANAILRFQVAAQFTRFISFELSLSSIFTVKACHV